MLSMNGVMNAQAAMPERAAKHDRAVKPRAYGDTPSCTAVILQKGWRWGTPANRV